MDNKIIEGEKMKTDYKKYIESSQDFPKPGVIYWDFTPLLMNTEVFSNAICDIENHFDDKGVTKIAAIEAKGFTIGSALAMKMKKPLVLIRKPHLTPGKILCQDFVKEYGKASYQIKEGVVGKGDKVLVVYDIMAGPGASEAAIKLIEKSRAKVIGCAYVIELEYLNGRKGLEGYDLFSLVKIEKKEMRKD